MVLPLLGLLSLTTALPTTIGVAEGIRSSQNPNHPTQDEDEDPFISLTTEAQRMRKFKLRCYCDAPHSRSAAVLNGKSVVLRGGRLWLRTSEPNPAPAMTTEGEAEAAFLGFYIPYPDPARKPSQLGLASFIPHSPTEPPGLNWIFVDRETREMRYGNRTDSIKHVVGPWAWDAGCPSPSPSPPSPFSPHPASAGHDTDSAHPPQADKDGGGLTLSSLEGAIALQQDEGEEWQLYWEGAGEEEGVKAGGRKMRVSLEREFVEEEQKGEEAEGGKGKAKEG
ncbi:MAG: hypothetical protein Q9220_005244 [cf. Caloplaca sp. 1 TL-2023]